MNDLTETKRLTLAATLVFAQMGRALDDGGDMYVRLVQRLHNQARSALPMKRLYETVRLFHMLGLVLQCQSAAIFGLAHLLGIQLQPRIRNWKGLNFYRSKPALQYEHIDLLFSKTIDWNLIETMLPEMLRIAVSIGAGRIKPSTILRRLATYSRKSKLYFAFRELGHAVRTSFLLEYLSDVELRQLIQSATNKSERFNQFVQWVAFGGGALAAEGIRDEQRKFIKYNHLVANLLIFTTS
jgi:TnpA family transposase